MFWGKFFAHPRKRETVIYSMWYKVPRSMSVGGLDCGELKASDRHQSGDFILHAVHHSLALLRMGKELPETCWADLKINKIVIYLNISQLVALNFMSLFHASTCFEHMCSSSGGQNCTIQPLVSHL